KELFYLGLKAINKLRDTYKNFQSLKPVQFTESLYERFNLHFSIGKTRIRDIIKLRKEIFVKEEGYPLRNIYNPFDTQAFHFIIQDKTIPIGCVSIYLDIGRGIPLENFISLRKYQSYRKAEIQKLAIIPEYRKSYISLSLMVISYEFIRFL
ncbi:MAG: hypothetical protein N2Z79_04310, partial [Candidatus Omnitrophica bacterium]|nr:hypothetical protein [Candidatus Omnitrophota bacterium]